MANEKRLIAAALKKYHDYMYTPGEYSHSIFGKASLLLEDGVDLVVRCQNCVHAEPLDRNCELSTTHYMHCKLWRGEETKNVWHKYKKYYKDYSLVERDGFCSDGAKMDGDGND